MSYPTAQTRSAGGVSVPKIQMISAGNVMPSAGGQNRTPQMSPFLAGWTGQQQMNDKKRLDEKKNTTEAYKAMADNPQAAEMIAQAYGVQFTPQLQKMLQRPAVLKSIAEAAEWAQKMNIKNPEAANKLMSAAAQQAMSGQPFNPVEVFGSIDGMEMSDPIARMNADTQRQNSDIYAGSMRGRPPASVTPQMLEEQNYLGAAKRGALDIQDPNYMDWANRYSTTRQPGAPIPMPGAAPSAGAGGSWALKETRPDGSQAWQAPDGSVKYFRPPAQAAAPADVNPMGIGGQ